MRAMMASCVQGGESTLKEAATLISPEAESVVKHLASLKGRDLLLALDT